MDVDREHGHRDTDNEKGGEDHAHDRQQRQRNARRRDGLHGRD
jgi:hypothetical protein